MAQTRKQPRDQSLIFIPQAWPKVLARIAEFSQAPPYASKSPSNVLHVLKGKLWPERIEDFLTHLVKQMAAVSWRIVERYIIDKVRQIHKNVVGTGMDLLFCRLRCISYLRKQIAVFLKMHRGRVPTLVHVGCKRSFSLSSLCSPGHLQRPYGDNKATKPADDRNHFGLCHTALH